MRIRPKAIWSPALTSSLLPKAASIAITSCASPPPLVTISESAAHQKDSPGKLSGKETGPVGSGLSNGWRHIWSRGSRHSSSLVPFASSYQNGYPFSGFTGPSFAIFACAGRAKMAVRAIKARNARAVMSIVRIARGFVFAPLSGAIS